MNFIVRLLQFRHVTSYKVIANLNGVYNWRKEDEVMYFDFQKIEEYEAWLIDEERSKATIQKYIRDLKGFYDFLPKDKELTKKNVVEYKTHLIDNYKWTSANSMIASINGFLKYLGAGNLTVKMLKIQKKAFTESTRQLTKKEYEKLLNAAKKRKNPRLYLLMQTICVTGIRVSEHKYITVESLKERQAIINNKGKIRYVYMPEKLTDVLLEYCRERGIKKGTVFVTKGGKPLDRSNIWKDMKRLCDEARVDSRKVFPHNLRHLFAFTFYDVEKDVVRLADILGHSSIETTRIYTMGSAGDYMAKLKLVNG